MGLTQFDLAANNLFIRGGLTIGSFNVAGNIISGKGLLEAHELEEKAVYPRIILNNSVVHEYITRLTQYSNNFPLLFDTIDNVVFLDFLSAALWDVMHQECCGLEVFRLQLIDVRNNIMNALKINSSDRVLSKYEWLAKYFDFFCNSNKNLGLDELSISSQTDIDTFVGGRYTRSLFGESATTE